MKGALKYSIQITPRKPLCWNNIGSKESLIYKPHPHSRKYFSTKEKLLGIEHTLNNEIIFFKDLNTIRNGSREGISQKACGHIFLSL